MRRTERLASLDALRGFDMLWIVGGREVIAALAVATNWSFLVRIERELHHVEWHGFTFWDLIFPLFLFLAGMSFPWSFGRRLEAGHSRRELHLKILRRGLLLVLLGVLYNAKAGLEDLRYASVLGRIGLAWMFAAWIGLHAGVRGRVLWIVGLLVGYWAALRWVPVPGFGAGDLSPGHTLTDWIDRQLMPGRLHRTVRDPEGLLGTVPAIATALLGMLTGERVRRLGMRSIRVSFELLVAGLLLLAAGALWSKWFPLNKNLWTSSFVLWTGGWSVLLFGLFHLVVDVIGWKRWSFPLTVLGTNAITAYLVHRFVDFEAGLAWALRSPEGPWALVGTSVGGLLLLWLVLLGLWRKKLFLRV